MWGYDLPRSPPAPIRPVQPPPAAAPRRPTPPEPECIFPLFTRGGPSRQKAFDWDYDPDVGESGAVVIRTKTRTDLCPLPELVEILHSLFERFGYTFFPLANNVAKMPKGTERNGLGMTIFNQPKSSATHAQAASYLGVVFEDLGLAKWNKKHRGIQWRLVRPPPTDVESLKGLWSGG